MTPDRRPRTCVRDLRRADVPSVRQLQGRLAYPATDLADLVVDGPFEGAVATAGRDGPADGGSSVADERSVVGYAIWLSGEPTALLELVVDPAWRRRGVGRALLDAVATGGDAGGATGERPRVVVTTPAADEGARGFYEACGFEPDRRLPGHYPDGTDALRLVRGQ